MPEELQERCLSLIDTLPPAQLSPDSAFAVQDAIRLAMVVDHRPCELCILGYSPDGGDVAKAVASIAAVQFASFFGYDFIFGN